MDLDLILRNLLLLRYNRVKSNQYGFRHLSMFPKLLLFGVKSNQYGFRLNRTAQLYPVKEFS